MTLAHRVAILERGVLQQLATPAEIYNNPANLFVAQFIGSPPMNMVQGGLEGKNFLANGARIADPGGGQASTRPYWACGPRIARGRAGEGRHRGRNLRHRTDRRPHAGDREGGSDMLTVKAPKDFTAKLGEKAGVAFSKDHLYVFDKDTGLRIR